MKKRNQIIASLLVAGSLAAAVPLFAQANAMAGGKEDCRGGHSMHGKHQQGDGLSKMMKNLNLTPEQQAQATALHKQNAEAMSEKFKTMRETRMQLREMQSKGEFDEARVKALTEKGAQAMAEMGQLRARQHQQMMQILTPEQRKQMEAQRDQMKQRWEKRQAERATKS